MTPSRPDNEAIFHAAREISDPDRRREYIRVACGGDENRIAHVEALLAAANAPDSLLDRPAAKDPMPTIDQPQTEIPGTMIGPYKLIEQIGEGGMGTVWMAQQTEPVKRLVALKLIKAGMDSKQIIARFEAERQALALMDHPNIARVLDAGTTSEVRNQKSEVSGERAGSSLTSDLCPLTSGSGRPYFVMELVKGVPITKYCDEHRLTPRQRLELFIPVCQAIQHAHQKGIIHRDLKPSNVLVAQYDGKPVPKVIDFGVAKAAGQPLTEQTLVTGFGAIVGTLEYMSPEQAEVNQLDIDTRSDIYSLGVLLYELLTGSPPFSRKELEKAGMLEMLRVIREQEPSKPSTKLSSSDALPTLSANRGTEPAKLTRLVRGELDWIVMKALEKDRSGRYETANGFAQDVQRYLADEAVQACPPSVGYRFRKFTRRNRGGLAVAALVLFFVVMLGSGVGWAVRDRSARQAEAARQRGERLARAGGQVESVFGEVDRLMKEQKWPEALAAARRAEAVVAGGEADDATAERVRERLKDLEFIDRLEHARMLKSTWLGREFDYSSADREYAQAFREYGIDVDALGISTSIARLQARPMLAIPVAAALDDWADIERSFTHSDVVRWKRREAVAHGIDPNPVADLLRSRWDRPLPEVQAELRRLVGSIDVRTQHPGTITSLAKHMYRHNGEPTALSLLRDAQRVYPEDFWLNYTLAHLLTSQKDYEGAARYYTAAISIRPRATAALNNLGIVLTDLKRFDEAVAIFRRALDVDPNFTYAHIGLGNALRQQKRLDPAITHYRKAKDIDPKDATALFSLADILAEQSKLEEATEAYCEAIKRDPKLIQAYLRLARVLERQNKLSEALDWLHKALQIDSNSAELQIGIGFVLERQLKLKEAADAYRKAIDIDQDSFTAHYNLGIILCDHLKEYGKAVECFQRAIKINSKDADAHFNLGVALYNQMKLDEAIEAYRKAYYLNRTNASSRQALIDTLGHRSWDLVGHADPKAHDTKQALELVQEAVDIAPQSVIALNWLGWVQYRAGNWQSSIMALEKSCEFGKGGDSGQWIVLALAHTKLAAQDGLPLEERDRHRTEARRRYEQADKQINSRWRARPTDMVAQAIWDFRAEARELIGAKEGKQ